MHRLLTRTFRMRLACTALLGTFIGTGAGCTAMAPGMHFSSGEIPSTAPSAQKPIVKPITPALIASEKSLYAQQNIDSVKALISSKKPYTIDSGDVLSIIVWDHPEMNAPMGGVGSGDARNGRFQSVSMSATPAGFVVDSSGSIQFPYAGSLQLAGLTEEQAHNRLVLKLSKYLMRPDLTLRVQSYRSKRIYVSGEVKTPGMVAISDLPMTLTEALHQAGGTLTSADQSRIVITRDGVSYPVNLVRLAERGINPSAIMLANGDAVNVISRDESKVFVSGEVMTPKALLMHDGKMSLNEALGEAGGINPLSGDGRQVYVIRNGGDAQPVVYHLNSRAPSELALAEDFELKPKDVVYVDATALTTWSRVVNLVLPSAASSAVSSAATFRAIR